MKETLFYELSEKAETMQEGTFHVPFACNCLRLEYNLSLQYTFLVFVRIIDPSGKVRLQKQLANSEPVIQIGIQNKDTTIGGIPGIIEAGVWTVRIYVFTEHLARILKGQKISFEIQISDEQQINTEGNQGVVWADQDFYYAKYDYEKTYQKGAGWYAGDLHTHTRLSDGKESPKSATEKAEQYGLDYYIPTEHNVLHTGWPDTHMMVMPGVEITTTLGHANIFGLDKMPENMEDFLIHKDMGELSQDTRILLQEKKDRNWIFSVNHPFLHIWKWNDDEINLNDIDCLEIINDPTYEADQEAKAKDANRKAVFLSDLLWADGYRICAIGGSDSHNLLDDWYEGAEGPSVPGDPMTYLYMEDLSPKNLLAALRNCRSYVTRHCIVETDLQFGSMLPENCDSISYHIGINGQTDIPNIFYYLNGRKVPCSVALDGAGSFVTSGTIWIPKQDYNWIRFGAEKTNGDFLFYGNPITKGYGKRIFQKYGEIRKNLELLWEAKSKEYYSTKMEL